MKRGKKYVEAAKNIDRQTLYEATEAVSLVKKSAVAKFDETIEAHIRTGCDGRHAEQQIRGAVVLPHGTGKTVKVLVFAKGAKAEEAEAAGADFVGGEELIPKIQNDNWFDFDVVVATPDMMGVVGRLGRVLGPKGLMPNPKAGTVTMDVQKLLMISRLVRSSTDLIRQISFMCQLVRLHSQRSSYQTTSRLLWMQSLRLNQLHLRDSI